MNRVNSRSAFGHDGSTRNIVVVIIIFFNSQYLIPEGKILKTKQVRPQRRLLSGESAVEGDRITPLESH